MKPEIGNKGKSNLSFSFELNSREYIKRVSLPYCKGDRLMVEGSLGKLISVELVEDIKLEIYGVNGIMRIEIARNELENVLCPRTQKED